MKKILLLFCLCSTFAFGQSKEQYIADLIGKEDYFTLRKNSALIDQSNSPLIHYMGKALLGTFFNKPREAINNIKVLLDQHQDEMGTGYTLWIAYYMMENYAALSQYDSAYIISSSLVSQVGDVWGGEALSLIKDVSKVYDVLKNSPKLHIKFDSCEIKLTPRHDGSLIIPVTDQYGCEHPFIFDTGGGVHSVISENSAVRFGAKILADSIFLPELNKMGKIGYVEKMTIGHIVAENVSFYILPDSLLQHRYKENQFDFSNILGWDIIGQARTIELSKEHVAFNKYSANSGYSSLMIMNSYPYTQVTSGTDTLTLLLDSGSNISYLNNRAWDKLDAKIPKTAVDSIGIMGVRGLSVEKFVTCKDFPLRVGGQDFILPEIGISISSSNPYGKFDGIIGQDLLELADKMIIDLENMTLIFKNSN